MSWVEGGIEYRGYICMVAAVLGRASRLGVVRGLFYLQPHSQDLIDITRLL